MASKTIERAIKTAPGRISKLNRGQPVKRDKRRFQAFTVSQLLETYRDPRAILLEIAGMDTAELAKHCNCTLADALAERRLCAQAVLPYVAQKLPAQIDMRMTRAINLNIVDDRQYQALVTVAAEATDDADSFSLQLLNGTADDAASNAAHSESPVTPPTPAPSGEEK
jgi:hypothetical protein